MLSLILPTPPGRGELWAFCIAVSVGAGLVVAGIVAGSGLAEWHDAGLAGMLVAAAVGGLMSARPNWFYHVWNRIAVGFARGAGEVLLAICFFTMFLLVGRAGSRLQLRPSRADSLWTLREPLMQRGYSDPGGWSVPGDRTSGLPAILSWSLHSRNLWIVALCPLLVLLRSFRNDVEYADGDSVPLGIYTLY